MDIETLALAKKYTDEHGGGGGTSYTAGEGINITNKTISVDEDVIQTKLTAGSNITIDNDVISATGSGDIQRCIFTLGDNNDVTSSLSGDELEAIYTNNTKALICDFYHGTGLYREKYTLSCKIWKQTNTNPNNIIIEGSIALGGQYYGSATDHIQITIPVGSGYSGTYTFQQYLSQKMIVPGGNTGGVDLVTDSSSSTCHLAIHLKKDGNDNNISGLNCSYPEGLSVDTSKIQSKLIAGTGISIANDGTISVDYPNGDTIEY